MAVQKEADAQLEKYAKEISFSEGAEQNAWTQCGSPTAAKSTQQLEMMLGCSMSRVCPVQLQNYLACVQQSPNDRYSTCQSDADALAKAFVPYLEKVYIKDPMFLLRESVIEKI